MINGSKKLINQVLNDFEDKAIKKKIKDAIDEIIKLVKLETIANFITEKYKWRKK